MTRWVPALLLAGVLLAGACLPGGRSNPFTGGGDRGSVRAEIHNNNQLDITVYVLRYGNADRLGMVISQTRESFELPRSWIDQGVPLALRAELIGSPRTFTTDTYVLEPGSVIELTVQNWLAQSSVTIR